MVVFARRIMPDLENHRTEAATTPSSCAELFRIVTPVVYQVHLIEYLPSLFQADAMFSFGIPALLLIEIEAHAIARLASDDPR